MPKAVLIIIVAFLVVMYLVTLMRQRKNRTKSIDTVKKFRETYLKNPKNKDMIQPLETAGAIRNYVTRYNSSEDFREKTVQKVEKNQENQK